MQTSWRAISIILLIITLLFPLQRTDAQVSPNLTGQIVYVKNDMNIWILQNDSGDEYQITKDGSETNIYLSPSYSPDGSKLAYCQMLGTGENKTFNLYIMQVGEWQPILIADDIFCDYWPSRNFDWSPDSNRIIYHRRFTIAEGGSQNGTKWQDYSGIWIVDITTGDRTEVIPPPNQAPLLNPHWSPDGSWIKFYDYSYLDQLGALMTGHNDSGTIYSWLGSGSVWPGYSDWSPDSTKIVFDEVPYKGYSGAGLYTATPKGEDFQKIFTSPGNVVTKPLWSPDGSTIAFQLKTADGSKSSLALINPDGSNLREVYSTDSFLMPVDWSPSSQQVIFVVKSTEAYDLYIHDQNTLENTPLGPVSSPGADWSNVITSDSQPQDRITIADFPYSESLMIYVAADHRLVLFDPVDKSEIDLTQSLTVTNFSPSPSGHHYIYGRHIATLEFNESDELIITEGLLPAIPVDSQINWSANEQLLSFVDWRGQYWIADVSGQAQVVTDATNLPKWSIDGSKISFCVNENDLNVLGDGIDNPLIAENIDCEVHWSPSKNLLAYTQPNENNSQNPRVFIYNADTDTNKMIYEGGEVFSWSPDGRFLAIKKQPDLSDPNSNQQIIITNQAGDKFIEAGIINDNSLGIQEWALTDSGHLFGNYQIAPDLSSAIPIADALLAYSKNGGRLFVLNNELDLSVLACYDVASSNLARLLSINLSTLSEEQRPGVWSWMSDDGRWIVNHIYIEGNYANLLLDCDNEQTSNLSSTEYPDIGTFSEDGNWFLMTQTTNGNQSYLVLSNLEFGGIERIDSIPRSNVTWVKSQNLSGIHTITGQVATKDRTPLVGASVFINGILITTTDDYGNFIISRLMPGEHEITIQKPGFKFSPPSYSLTLPPDVEGLFIEAEKGNPPKESAPTPTVSQITAGETPEGEQAGIEKQEPEVSSNSITDKISDGWNGFIMPFLGLFAELIGQSPIITAGFIGLCAIVPLICLILILWQLRKKSVIKEPEPAKVEAVKMESELEDTTQPVQVTAQAEEELHPVQEVIAEPEIKAEPITEEKINEWIAQGTSFVKNGNYEQGHQVFRKIVQEKPDEARAWLWLGYISAHKKDWKAAERRFRLAKHFNHPKADQAFEWLNKQKKQ